MDYVIEYYDAISWTDITDKIENFETSFEINIKETHQLEYHGISLEYRYSGSVKIGTWDLLRIKLINGTTEYLFSGYVRNIIETVKTRILSFDVVSEIEFLKTRSIGDVTNLWQFTVSGITILPDNESVYQDVNSKSYNIIGHNMSGSSPYSGLIDCKRTSGGVDPPASGTLTKVSGIGDANITYSAWTKTMTAGYIPGFRLGWRLGYVIDVLNSYLTEKYSIVYMDMNAESCMDKYYYSIENILYPSTPSPGFHINDLIYDTQLIVNSPDKSIPNKIFLNIVNKELRFSSENGATVNPTILEEIQDYYDDEYINNYYLDAIDAKFKGNGVSGATSGEIWTLRKSKYKINTIEKFTSFDKINYSSVNYGNIIGIEKKGNMYTYTTALIHV